MTIIRSGTFQDVFAEIINSALSSAESLDFSTRAMSQTDNFPKRNALILHYLKWLATLQHRFIKPPPRPYEREREKHKKKKNQETNVVL